MVSRDVVTSALDDHVMTAGSLTTPTTAQEKREDHQGGGKRRSKEEEATPPPVRFTIGQGGGEEGRSAKKRLQLSTTSSGGGSSSRQKTVVRFTKLGGLSPKKKLVSSSSSGKQESPQKTTVSFEKLGGLSPRKQPPLLLSPFKAPPPAAPVKTLADTKRNLSEAISRAEAVSKKLSPAEVKAKLGQVGKLRILILQKLLFCKNAPQVGKLAELKQRLESLNAASRKLKQSRPTAPSVPKAAHTPATIRCNSSSTTSLLTKV